jgi:hypothetical protein
MAQAINVPTQLRHWRVPVRWELYKDEFSTRFRGIVATGVAPIELDGPQCWEEFFTLPEDDSALFGFLNKVGLWKSDPPAAFIHHQSDEYKPVEVGGRFVMSYIPTITPEEIWSFRERLRDALPNRKKFIEKFAAPLKTPKPGHARQDLLYNQFFVRFELSGKDPAAVISTVSLREMILAINYHDFARGARYQICARKDCPHPFFRNATGDPRKIYCSQDCGHLVSVRNSRKK